MHRPFYTQRSFAPLLGHRFATRLRLGGYQWSASTATLSFSTSTRPFNPPNARLTKGKEFDLKLSDFSWHLEGSETAPAITNLYSQGSSATQEDAKRSILVLNSTGVINGERLVAEGAMTSVIVMDPSGESVAEVDTFSKSSEALLMFEIPADFVEEPGDYRLVVERVEVAPDGTSRIYRSLERQIKFVR